MTFERGGQWYIIIPLLITRSYKLHTFLSQGRHLPIESSMGTVDPAKLSLFSDIFRDAVDDISEGTLYE